MNKPNLFRKRYPPGYLIGVIDYDLYVWVAVHIETGEVEMSIEPYNDELRKLVDGWEWKKFRLIEVND